MSDPACNPDDPLAACGPESCAPRPPPAARPAEVPAEVVERLQRRDPDALAAVVDCYGARVLDTCRRVTGSREDAEDAAQEVFLRVFARAGRFRGECRFGTWLLRVAVNHAINLCKSGRRHRARSLEDLESHVQTALPAPGPAPLETVADREERGHLERALLHLPVDQRTVLVLRDFEGLTYGEIATLLELPPGTVNSRIVRARQRLLEILRHRLPQSLAGRDG